MGYAYQDLLVWQKARALSIAVYKCTESFPKTEIFGLTSQLRRAGISVVSNIAEGQGRLTKGEFQQFLGHARGSLLELATQIEISRDLGYLREEDCADLMRNARQVLGLLNRLIESLRGRRAS